MVRQSVSHSWRCLVAPCRYCLMVCAYVLPFSVLQALSTQQLASRQCDHRQPGPAIPASFTRQASAVAVGCGNFRIKSLPKAALRGEGPDALAGLSYAWACRSRRLLPAHDGTATPSTTTAAAAVDKAAAWALF
jgi:hypothetical protein